MLTVYKHNTQTITVLQCNNYNSGKDEISNALNLVAIDNNSATTEYT
jgi:hypothetical protein